MRILLDTHILLLGSHCGSKIVTRSSDPFEITEAIHKTGCNPLPITFEHCTLLSGLPSIHSDPFVRMLVVQSLSEPAMLVTHDRLLRDYGNSILLV